MMCSQKKNLEPTRKKPTQINVDILTQTVAISIKSLYGVYGVELWWFNEETGVLENIALSSDDIELGATTTKMARLGW